MKTYKNFLTMVRWNDPDILNDLVGWMRRCAFDEVRLNIPRPAETPEWQSKTAANAKKKRIKEAVAIGEKIFNEYGYVFNENIYSGRFETNDLDWVSTLCGLYPISPLTKVHGNIDRMIAKMENSECDYISISDPTRREEIRKRYYVPKELRLELFGRCMEIYGINLDPNPVYDSQSEESSAAIRKFCTDFKRICDSAAIMSRMSSDMLFTSHELPFDRTTYTNEERAMIFCMIEYMKTIHDNALNELMRCAGLIAKSYLFGSAF